MLALVACVSASAVGAKPVVVDVLVVVVVVVLAVAAAGAVVTPPTPHPLRQDGQGRSSAEPGRSLGFGT